MPKPRSLGLWSLNSDEAEVKSAREHLLKLLDDPYYYEAYQTLKKENHEKLHGLSGRKSKIIGIAAKYQHQIANNPQKKKHGRPKNPETEDLIRVLSIINSAPGNLKQKCYRLITKITGRENHKTANDFYNKLRNLGRRQKMR